MSRQSDKSYLLVLSNPVVGMEDAFNEWYTHVHLPEVLQIDGTVNARRFRITKAQMTENQPYEYVVMYEIESGKEADAIANLKAALPTMNMQPVIDIERSHMMVISSISDLIAG